MKTSLERNSFLLLVALVTVAFFGLVGTFLMAAFWAVVFAILFHDSYDWFLKRLKGRKNLSAGVTVLFVLLIVIIPLGIVLTAVAVEAQHVYEALNRDGENLQEQVTHLEDYLPITAEKLEKLGLDVDALKGKVTDFLGKGTELVAGKAVKITGNIFSFFISFVLMMYFLFFFIRDGKKLTQELVWTMPMDDDRERELIARFESVARATVKGSLLVALIQGAMGGILFWAVGIPAAFLWGVLMVLASLLPVGNAIVWAPWAVALLMRGDISEGIVVAVVGTGLIGLIDNFLRPRLVGKDTKMPDYLILLSTFGGLVWFGLTGFVLGPIIAALFVTCWHMMGREYGGPREDVVTED